MNVAWTTWKKELWSYLFSPVGWIVLVLLYAFRGLEISSLAQAVALSGADRDQFATAYLLRGSSFILMILVPPILTMRCFAEEKRTGSLEVLMTAPVRDGEIVVGKWAAAFTFFAILWLPAILVLGVLQGDSYLGVGIAAGPVLSGLLGMFLVGAMLLAVGCFTSSLTDNQLLAVLMSILFAAALLFGPGIVAPFVAERGIADAVGAESEAWLSAALVQDLLRQVDVFDHLQSWFFRGLINTGHIVFYVVGTAFFLFLTTRSLESRRWR